MIRERILTVASELRRIARHRVIESELEWPGKLRLTRLRPVKTTWRGHVMNKAGKVVMRGELAGAPIKLYEVESDEHAIFIEALTKLDEIAAWFPKVIARHGRCVVTEWVEGEMPGDDLPLPEIIEIQVRLHRVAASRLPPRGYDFWGDFLRPRFVRAADMLGSNVDDIVALVDAETARPPLVLVHPDFRPANLIRATDARWMLIDNEYCATSGLPLLDICHTAKSLRERSTEYWQIYRDLSGVQPSTTTLAALQGAWLARLVGAAFVTGNIGAAAATLQRYRLGHNLLPFDPS